MKIRCEFILFAILVLFGMASTQAQTDPVRINPVLIDPRVIVPDAIVITVEASHPTTTEADAKRGVFIFKRSGPKADPVAVTYRVTGTADTESDYDRLPGYVLIPAGADAVEIAVAAIDDKIAELDETVTLTVVSPIRPLATVVSSIFFGYQIGEPASATVTIKDNDLGNVALPTVEIKATAPEAAEAGPKSGTFVVSRVGDTKAPLTVAYEILNERITWPDDGLNFLANFPIYLVPPAENGVDYKKLTGALTIPAGETSLPVSIDPIDDSQQEGREQVTLRLMMSEAYNINRPNRATVFILDDDPNQPRPVIRIVEPKDGAGFETGQNVTIVVEEEPRASFVKSVEFFADGKSLGVRESNPASASPINPFRLVWEKPPDGVHVLTAKALDSSGATHEASPVRIVVGVPSKPTVVTIHPSIAETLESDPSQPGVFKVVRTGSLATKLNVHYFIEGTAKNGVDYKELSGTVTIPTGETSAAILVTPVPDKALEGNETVKLILEQRVYIVAPPPEDDYLVGEPKSAVVEIRESPTRGTPPKVDISQPKDGEAFPARPTIRIVVQAADADGYVPRMELYAGSRMIDSETRHFLVKPPNGQVETFVFEWKNVPTGEHKLTAKAIDDSGQSSTSSVVQIKVGLNPDLPVVTITAPDPYALENGRGNPGQFKVQRTGGTRTKLIVSYAIGGDARNGVDFEEIPATVTIPEGRESATIAILGIPDKALEGKESVILTLEQRVFVAAPPAEENYLVGSSRSAAVTIYDEDPPRNNPPKVALTSPKAEAVFVAGADVEIKAETADEDGIVVEVSFFANDKLLGSVKEAPFNFIWKGVLAGKYSLRAKATDDDGASTTSTRVDVTVKRPFEEGFVKRDLPDAYTPGEVVKVVLTAAPIEAVQVYAIEDRPPNGWILGAIAENGVFDPVSKKVKFGPFFDNQPRVLTYELTPPAGESGTKEFSGTGSANGVDSTIGGDRTIVANRNEHPADNDPANHAINIKELTAYSLAWKTGKNWPTGPNPIPQSYVTRAGEIWRKGEAYIYDAAQGPAPLWWVPKPRAALLSVNGAAASEADDQSARPGNAKRSFNRIAVPDGTSYLVTIVVLPKAGVDAYTLEERPPAGWGVSDVSDDGNFDSSSGAIRWGIFLDDKVRSVTYRVQPVPMDHQRHAWFEGGASFDGIDIPIHSDKEPDRGNGRALGKLKGVHRHSTGEVEVSLSGEEGRRYRVQVSNNLIDWTDLGSGVNNAGEIQVLDTSAADASLRYYRALSDD